MILEPSKVLTDDFWTNQWSYRPQTNLLLQGALLLWYFGFEWKCFWCMKLIFNLVPDNIVYNVRSWQTRKADKTRRQDKLTGHRWQDKLTRQADRKGDKTCWQDRWTEKADKTCRQDRRTNQAEKQADKTSKDLITLVL